MSQIQNGDTEGGASALRDVANDVAATTAVRAEAAYHLASIAAGKGDAKAVGDLATQILSIDPTSSWAQRVTLLQATLPVDSAEAGPSEVSFGTP